MGRRRRTSAAVLHGAGGFRPDSPFLSLLDRNRRVFAPSHPGFGVSALPDWMDRPDDIAHLYLNLLDRIGGPVDVVACSFVSWIAAELAVMAPAAFRRLVLVGPAGPVYIY